jgi:hypothetical protein
MEVSEMIELKPGTPVMFQNEFIGLFETPKVANLSHKHAKYCLIRFGRRGVWVKCRDIRVLTESEWSELKAKLTKNS